MFCSALSPRLGSLVVMSVVLAASTGCSIAPTAAPGGNSSTPPNGANSLATGNWQGNLTASSGKKALGAISGSIDQSGGNTSAGQFTTAVFRVQAPCYAGTPVPSQGFVNGTSVTLNSFAVEHQYLNLTGTLASSGSSIDGTYMAYGGCADGSGGALSLQRYQPFTGTYAPSASADRGITLTTSQSDGADGSGAFPVAATAKFSNFGCFSEGTAMLTDDPQISGSSFDLLFTTNDSAGSKLHLTGTINTSATSVTAYSFSVSGGSCNGMTGSGSLTRM